MSRPAAIPMKRAYLCDACSAELNFDLVTDITWRVYLDILLLVFVLRFQGVSQPEHVFASAMYQNQMSWLHLINESRILLIVDMRCK